MESSQSEHFVVYFQPGSTAQKELSKVIDTLENDYKRIVDELDIKIRPTISCHLYQTKKAKLLATGESANAHTDRKKFEFYAIYNTKTKAIGCHEIVHLLTDHLGHPNYLFNEGLAEYFEINWTGMLNHKLTTMSHDQWAQCFIENDSFIPIIKLFNDHIFWELDPSGVISYPEAGSFIKFLVKRYGINKVMAAYKQLKKQVDKEENLKIFNKLFEAYLVNIEQEWMQYLIQKNHSLRHYIY
jgi:hypothetical protein